jgi:heme/copper-type cytochrome/quinol oxidase subunit 2
MYGELRYCVTTQRTVVVILVVVLVLVVVVMEYSLRNNPEERSSQLLRGENLKSRNVYGDTFATSSI